jgi:hypothetical protein
VERCQCSQRYGCRRNQFAATASDCYSQELDAHGIWDSCSRNSNLDARGARGSEICKCWCFLSRQSVGVRWPASREGPCLGAGSSSRHWTRAFLGFCWTRRSPSWCGYRAALRLRGYKRSAHWDRRRTALGNDRWKTVKDSPRLRWSFNAEDARKHAHSIRAIQR